MLNIIIFSERPTMNHVDFLEGAGPGQSSRSIEIFKFLNGDGSPNIWSTLRYVAYKQPNV